MKQNGDRLKMKQTAAVSTLQEIRGRIPGLNLL